LVSGYLVGCFLRRAPSYSRLVFPEHARPGGKPVHSRASWHAVRGSSYVAGSTSCFSLVLGCTRSALGQPRHGGIRTCASEVFHSSRPASRTERALPFNFGRSSGRSDLVIDLRSLAEAPVSTVLPRPLRMECRALERAETGFPPEPRLVLLLSQGVRAWRAARRNARPRVHELGSSSHRE